MVGNTYVRLSLNFSREIFLTPLKPYTIDDWMEDIKLAASHEMYISLILYKWYSVERHVAMVSSWTSDEKIGRGNAPWIASLRRNNSQNQPPSNYFSASTWRTHLHFLPSDISLYPSLALCLATRLAMFSFFAITSLSFTKAQECSGTQPLAASSYLRSVARIAPLAKVPWRTAGRTWRMSWIRSRR